MLPANMTSPQHSPVPPLLLLGWGWGKVIGKTFCFASLKRNSYFINLFIYGCVGSSFLCEGFLQLRRAGATLHRGARASHCRGLSRCGAQAPDAQAPDAQAHRLSCSAACGIFPDQGSNPCPLHWQADSQPLCHQGSPRNSYFRLKG